MIRLLRRALRLSLLGGIGYGLFRALRGRSNGASSWPADPWVSTGERGATPPSASPAATDAPSTAPARPEPPAAESVTTAPAAAPPAEASEEDRDAAVGAGADSAAGSEPPASSRPAPGRPPKAAGRTGPARRAPTGKASPPGDRLWVQANDGVCPQSHPIKAKLASRIFHSPGGRNYSRTKADRCYPDAGSAAADGLRPAQH